MFARLSTRYAMIALVAFAMVGIVRPVEAANPSPASILIAKQIVEIKGVKSIFEPMVRGVIEKAKGQFLQANFMWSKDINEVAVIVHKDYDSRVGELVDATARIYADHFTEAELKDMLAFYQTPVGKKMIVEEPKVMDESMANAGNWADNLSIDVLARMRAEMKKRGHDL